MRTAHLLGLLIAFAVGGICGYWLASGQPRERRKQPESQVGVSGSEAGSAARTATDGFDCASLESGLVSNITFRQVSLYSSYLPETGIGLRGDGSAGLSYSVRGRMSEVIHIYEGAWATGGDPRVLHLCLTRAADVKEIQTDDEPDRPEMAHPLPWHIEFEFRSPTELKWASADDSGFQGSHWRFVPSFVRVNSRLTSLFRDLEAHAALLDLLLPCEQRVTKDRAEPRRGEHAQMPVSMYEM